MSAAFVAGFSAVFLAFGASASLLGQLLLRWRYEANLVAGAIVILFGLFMLGLSRWMPFLQRDLRLHPSLRADNPAAAFLLGVAFAFGWTPCIGPVLGAILAVSAANTSAGGMGLLGAYALGLGVPFLAAAAFVDRAASITRRLRRFGAGLQLAGGLVMVALGLLMVTDRLTAVSLWLLQTFPSLRGIG
jgi:cytochrome c-type biogenesis protein